MDIYIPPGNTKKCLGCKNVLTKRKYEYPDRWGKRRYCSILCFSKSQIGRPSWNKGKTGYMSIEGRSNIGESTRNTLKNLSREQIDDRISKMVKYRRKHDLFKGTLGRTGELSAPWKGDDANYNSKHKWIQKHWKKTGTCTECGKVTKPFGNRRWGTEWHNINKEYNREDKSGWVELCSKCHKLADKKLWIPDEITT